MTRRISLPGADELFRKTTLSAVPDQVVEEVEVAHTNRPTTQSVTKEPQKAPEFAKPLVDVRLVWIKDHQVEKSMMRKSLFIYRPKSCLI